MNGGTWPMALMVLLFAALFFNIYMAARGRKREIEFEQARGTVLRVLTVLAETEPDPDRRAKLLKALHGDGERPPPQDLS